ncbi:MAG TPA: ester cyclase [Minicystis sp.]|nr:ester cyclase [Minicystis sp.]
MTTDATPAAAATSPESVARRLFELLNRRDLDALAELQHPDVVDDFVVLRPARGRAEVRAFFEALFAAFPDFHLEIERVTATGDTAVVQWRSTGTFTGAPFEGVHANGKRVEIRGVDCMVFEDGRLRHNTIYYDGMSFARAIGLLPAQGSGAERAMAAAFNAATALKKTLGV